MNQQANFENWANMAKKVQAPLQAITELNIKTLQDLAYLKPEEIVQLKKPEEFMEKQIKVFIENGHKTLDHLQKSFQIFETAMTSLLQEKKG